MGKIFETIGRGTVFLFISLLMSKTEWYINSSPNMFEPQNMIFVSGIIIMLLWSMCPIYFDVIEKENSK